MELRINKKGCTEIISLDIEPGASVSDLINLLHKERDKLLEHVPFDIYQKVITLHVVDLYSEHFETKMEPGNTLFDYGVNESSTIILDNFTPDKFLFMNRLNSKADIVPAARNKTNFFAGNSTEFCRNLEHECPDSKAPSLS